MAGSLLVGRLSILEKRLVTQFTSTTTPTWKRNVQSSVYDKNQDEHIHPSLIPGELIHTQSSGDYWAPHPKTGVFGPASDHNYCLSTNSMPIGAGTKESVLEVKAFFRSIEDLDKPPYHF